MEQEPILLPQIVQILPEWGALKPADIKATRLVGITNNIFKVTHNKHGIKPDMLIFRVFGSESESSPSLTQTPISIGTSKHTFLKK